MFIHPSVAFGLLIQFSEFNSHEWIDNSEIIQGSKEWEIKKKEAMYFFIFDIPEGV